MLSVIARFVNTDAFGCGYSQSIRIIVVATSLIFIHFNFTIMSELVIKGTIKSIGDVQVVSEKFKKVEFVVVTDDKFPKSIALQITNDKIDNFVKYNSEGQEVEVKFNIESKEFNGRWFTNLIAWRVQSVGDAQKQESTPIVPIAPSVKSSDDSDLPF